MLDEVSTLCLAFRLRHHPRLIESVIERVWARSVARMNLYFFLTRGGGAASLSLLVKEAGFLTKYARQIDFKEY